MNSEQLAHAITCLTRGEIIAYPTEAVYGIGCDPFNEAAVCTLLALKQREASKGLILIASDWKQIEHLVVPLKATQLQQVWATWPGPTTWVFPASEEAPNWIKGSHQTIALRITRHPIAHALSQAFGKPLVSTSANLTGHPPAMTAQEVEQYFQEEVSFIIEGEVGGLSKPTSIRDVQTGKFYRD